MEEEKKSSSSASLNEEERKEIAQYQELQESLKTLKDQVGQCIFDFVVQNVGADLAPKITGMLIALPCAEIRHFMASYENLQAKSIEAREHLLKTIDEK